ncbi:hypothetical protein [Nocardioides sp. CFH 31398]|uniref:hypothetical protein n=1 Tax=Nocardioides sp. CFH 31398 TaxID=2919579 RepID=UPI001F06BB38|nr:hypothetical protein [Nocardioides sp. CFH 31398]MCH1868194.1 hypothetical protein [Nocardioides sp. CFH 31398]
MDPRPAYDEAASPQQMAHDGRVARRRLRLLEQAARLATRPAPELTWEAWSRQAARPELKPGISVDAAAARLASLYVD